MNQQQLILISDRNFIEWHLDKFRQIHEEQVSPKKVGFSDIQVQRIKRKGLLTLQKQGKRNVKLLTRYALKLLKEVTT